MKRNILILEDASEMGGVQHSTINFINGAKQQSDFSFIVLLPGTGTFSDKLDKEGIDYFCYPPIELISTSFVLFTDKFRIPNFIGWVVNLLKMKRSSRGLYSILINENACLLITKGMGSHFLGGLVAKKMGIPCIMYLQDEISVRFFGLNNFVFNFIVKKYSTLSFADGESIRNQLWYESRTNCHLIYNGVSPLEMYQPAKREEIREKLGIPSNAYVIAHLARMIPWKGQYFLLDAFIRYAQEDESAYLILMGTSVFADNSYLDNLKNKALNSGFIDRIKFTGYINNPGDYFSAMDLFIYPSVEKDTTPLALLSALMSGKSVVMSDIPSLSEIHNLLPEIGLFKSRSIDDILTQIRKYKYFDKRVSENLRLKAINLFSIEVMTKKILTHIIRFC